MIGASSIGLVASAEARSPIRIGVSISMSGSDEVMSQNRGRAYQLCVKHTNSGTTSIYRKGRKFVFMVSPSAESPLEGLIDLAAKRGLKAVADAAP